MSKVGHLPDGAKGMDKADLYLQVNIMWNGMETKAVSNLTSSGKSPPFSLTKESFLISLHLKNRQLQKIRKIKN